MRTGIHLLTMVSAIALSLGAATQAQAQTQSPPGQTPPAQTPVTSNAATPAISDAKFVEQAAADGKTEVDLGKTAAQKASNGEVKSFAEEMVRDHGKVNAELMKLAGERGFAPQGSKGNAPLNTPSGAEQQVRQSLAALSGDAFDRQYMKGQEQSHVEAIKLFKAEAADGHDEQLRRFATAQLPTLNHHLDRAHSVLKSLGQPSAATGAPKTAVR